ncbi:MAG TPA: ABC-2 transporter permease [Candidatus Scybalocola faecavium]|nr:ABC-2 transporter permease [Candidatus Scybalocola faecavium]
MKGLLIKDFKLMKNQKSFFIILLVICVAFINMDSGENFILGFFTFICSLFCVTTISYDEFDNGNAFLFTLPFTRSTYVWEKYCLGLLTGTFAWLIAFVMATAAWIMKSPGENFMTQWLPECVVILLIDWIVLALMIPFQLKFGAERSRFAMLIAFGAIFLLVLLGGQLLSLLKVDLTGIDRMMTGAGGIGILSACLAAGLICLALSFSISKRIVEKKEF